MNDSGTARRTLMTLWVLLALAVAGVMLQYVAGTLFLLANRQLPRDLELTSYARYWQAYSQEPGQRARLQFAGVLALLLTVVAPLAVILLHRRRTPALHGAARFASESEVRRLGLYADARGIIVGRRGTRFLIYPGQQFVLLAAPTRSGKGVSVVIPNLLNYPDSVVVLDIKQENFAATSGYRAAHGHAVYLFNPFAEDGRTHRWNPLQAISPDPRLRVGELLALGQAIYPNDSRADPFWNEQARNLFLGLALYLFETPNLPVTMGELLRQASGKGAPLHTHLARITNQRSKRTGDGPPPLSDTCLDALSRFIHTTENTRSGILATFSAPLTIFANPFVDAATSASDFDQAQVRRQRMSIYVGIAPHRLADAALLVNIFFSQLINLNTRSLPEQDATLRYQCLLILDECTAIGRLAILARSVAFIAGYNLRLLTIVQSIAQLRGTYGEDDARTFATNHALQIVFAPREQRDANEYSEMLGTYTQRTHNRSRSQSGGFATESRISRGENESQHRRALLLPQELKELNDDEQIVLLQGARPIRCRKNRYFDDPVFTVRLLPSVQVPRIDIDLAQAKAENRHRPLEDDEPIDASRLVFENPLPQLDDPQNPSGESLQGFIQAIIDNRIADVDESPEREDSAERPERRR